MFTAASGSTVAVRRHNSTCAAQNGFQSGQAQEPALSRMYVVSEGMPALQATGGRLEPRRVVHPPLHVALSALARRAAVPAAGFRAGRPGVHDRLLQGAGVTTQRALREALDAVGGRRGGKSAHHATGSCLLPMAVETQADFAWHLCAWGRRVLPEARRPLAARYPTYAEFEPSRRAGQGIGNAEGAAYLGTAAAPAAHAERPTRCLRRRAERGVRRLLSGGRAQSALGGQADGGVSVGAHRALRGMPPGSAALEDALVVQEPSAGEREGRPFARKRQQARSVEDDGGRERCRLRYQERRFPWARAARRGGADGIGRPAPYPAAASPARVAA